MNRQTIITLRDIAKLAGVSTATVSRVLNKKEKGNMRKATCERIKRIIKQTGYTPHALASGLRKGLSNVIGVILPDNVNPYYAQLGKAVENECFNNGYLTLFCNTNSDRKREAAYIKHLTGQRVSGILLCSTGLTGKEIRELVPDTINVILMDEELEDFSGDVVIGDDYKGGYEGARYLYNLGHADILIITGPEKRSSTENRLRGFLDFISETGMVCDERYIMRGDYNLRTAYNIVKEALIKKLRFSVVFAFNDLMAIGVIKAISENNLSVPQDVSVLGYDNIFIDDLTNPSITTVATPFEDLGRIAVKRLLERIDSESKRGERILLQPTLIVRESCCQLKKAQRKK
ncbi:MAG TPA: LacI family transcriptional regulator [Spirochaetes bacterium]|nr:LacI family transcriptional regulator [Spirochaetota bacterium]